MLHMNTIHDFHDFIKLDRPCLHNIIIIIYNIIFFTQL